MKKLTLILASVAALSAQSFPTSIYAPLKAVDNLQTTLSTAMTAGDTTAFVASTTRWVANSVAYICETSVTTGGVARCTVWEVMLVTAVPSANALTVTRGYAGTSAIAHAVGKAILNAPTAVYNKAVNDEVLAIETALGANLSNVSASPVLRSSTYNFAAQTCASSGVCTAGGSSGLALVIGSNSLTMTPVPLGVNGTDSGHALYVSGGTGTAEACPITGGAGTSGQSSGQIIITCTNTHSGAYTVQSANSGIQEALQLGSTTSSRVVIPGGAYTSYYKITLPANMSLRGSGMQNTYINMASGFVTRAMEAIAPTSAHGVDIGDFTINYASNGTSQEGLYLQEISDGVVSNLAIIHSYSGITGVGLGRVIIAGVNLFPLLNGYNISSNSGSLIQNVSVPTIMGGFITMNSAASGTVISLAGNIAGLNVIGVQSTLGSLGISAIAASGAINEVKLLGNTIDSTGSLCVDLNLSGTATASRWSIIGNTFSAAASGGTCGIAAISAIAGAITAFTARDNTILGNDAGLSGFNLQGTSGTVVSGSLVSNGVAGGTCILLDGVANNDMKLSENFCGLGTLYTTANSLAYGVFINAQAHTRINITDNVLVGSTAALANSSTVAGGVRWVNNKGIDDVFGTAASAATLAFPVQPNFTISGSTDVTAVSGLFAGRTGTLTCTAGTLAFTLGATIGNSAVCQQNVPMSYSFDGTKVWLTGASPPAYNAAGTIQLLPHYVFGTCTLGTNCAVTFALGAAFTSSSSYYCTATDRTAAAAVKVVNTSSTVATFTGTGTDLLAYICVGN